MEDEILPILKFSYDNLKGEHIKSCFLYCALFPEDFIIYKGDLISYWICEMFRDESKGMERAENKAYEIMGSLICSSLLIQHEERSNFVYLHDVVREMALWIASDFGKQKDNFIVHACVGLEEIPKVQNWNIVKRMSLMFNKDQTCIWQPGLSLTHSFVAAAQQDTGKYLRHFLLEHAKSRCFGSIG